MTDQMVVTVSTDQTMVAIRETLQKVLSEHPEARADIEQIWLQMGALDGVVMLLAGMVAEAQGTLDAMQEQRNQAVDVMNDLRRFNSIAPEHERQRLAERLADRGNTDAAKIRTALDFLGGNRRGDGSQFAEMDVVRALERLGVMLGQERRSAS